MVKKTAMIVVCTMLALGFFIASDCKKEEPLAEGDLVYAQYWEGEGEGWEEAKVVSLEGEEATIEWKRLGIKSEPQATKHINKIVKMVPLEAKKVKEGTKVIVQADDLLYQYVGKVTKKDKDIFTVDFLYGDTTYTREVGIQYLWKAPE
ncbi:hypothetical protein JXM67_06020 [candidate division WOR-3 bacterium]|nr:hypothetical protein [candidate division WOR-3 bacterium]